MKLVTFYDCLPVRLLDASERTKNKVKIFFCIFEVGDAVGTKLVSSENWFWRLARSLFHSIPSRYSHLQPVWSDCIINWFFKKWAILGIFLVYFCLFKQTLQFLYQIYVKKWYVHPVYGTMIQTHNLWNMSLLPKPLDLGSRPSKIICLIFSHFSNENLPHGIEKCHIQNKPLKVAKDLKFCQSCGILPNLVTLFAARVS